MYKVQVLLRSVELPTQKTWKTKNWEVRTTTIGATIPKSLNDDFIQKCEFEGKTKSHKIRKLIEHYTYGSTPINN